MFKIILIIILLSSSLQGRSDHLKISNQFTNDSLFLARKLIVDKKKIYVFDEGADMSSDHAKILIFNIKGEYLRKFGQTGEGPGEFKSLRDIIIKDNKLYLLDGFGQAINIYNLKDLVFIKRKRYSSATTFSTPDTFCIDPSGRTLITHARGIKGNKIISVFDNDMKKLFAFMNCKTTYNTKKDMIEAFRKNKDESIRKGYYNQGYITNSEERIYYLTWMFNDVLEFNMGGELLQKYKLPIDSIGKTVEIVKRGKYKTIKKRLNYQLIYKNNKLYALTRNPEGDSIIFVFTDRIFKKEYKIKEQIFSFDISGDKLFAVDRDRSIIYMYQL